MGVAIAISSGRLWRPSERPTGLVRRRSSFETSMGGSVNTRDATLHKDFYLRVVNSGSRDIVPFFLNLKKSHYNPPYL